MRRPLSKKKQSRTSDKNMQKHMVELIHLLMKVRNMRDHAERIMNSWIALKIHFKDKSRRDSLLIMTSII
jgi:hypothetical protein